LAETAGRKRKGEEKKKKYTIRILREHESPKCCLKSCIKNSRQEDFAKIASGSQKKEGPKGQEKKKTVQSALLRKQR